MIKDLIELGMLKNMKQMEYGNGKNEILHYGTYRGRDYVVVNLHGHHPCAYVHSNIDYYHNDTGYDCPAHWGLTFYGTLKHWEFARYDKDNYDENFFNRKFIGWDYAHCDDYIEGLGGKKWTTEEILENVIEVIDWMLMKERK